MARQGDMMEIEDVIDILAIDLLAVGILLFIRGGKHLFDRIQEFHNKKILLQEPS
jgi:hypothetical protein